MTIISLLVFLIIIGLCFWAVAALAGALSIPAPIVVVIQVLLVIVAIVYLLQGFGLMGGELGGPLRIR